MMFIVIRKIIIDPQEKPRLLRELQRSGGVPDKVVFTHQGAQSWSVPR
jgi:hypothetical protein